MYSISLIKMAKNYGVTNNCVHFKYRPQILVIKSWPSG